MRLAVLCSMKLVRASIRQSSVETAISEPIMINIERSEVLLVIFII